MQAPLEIGQILTPTLAVYRGYEVIRDQQEGQIYKVAGERHHPPIYVVVQGMTIVTLTIYEVLAQVGLYVL